MTALDPAAEAYLEQLLAVAPPPPADAIALFARAFGPTTTDTTPMSDAA